MLVKFCDFIFGCQDFEKIWLPTPLLSLGISSQISNMDHQD